MNNYIDIGIDFGAENIVVVAIGYDNKGRPDYKLLNLDASGSVKNYIGQKKESGEIEIGSNTKISYIYHNPQSDFAWVEGRYKAYIAESETPGFAKKPEELLKYGLEKIIDKINSFDFSPLLSGKLRNLTVGMPQSWDYSKKTVYYDTLTYWKHGSVKLLPEPVAATIAAYKRSSAEIDRNIIMILDIGASTFDISFARYNETDKSLDIFKTTYRSELAGNYFDRVFAAFTLQSEQNRLVSRKLIDRIATLKLKKTEDYIDYLAKNQDKFSALLLETEMIKENNLFEIVKFNRKKLIDVGAEMPITVNKKIYTDALAFYTEKLATDINKIIGQFKNNEKLAEDHRIFPFLCGGASSLLGLEKNIRDKIHPEAAENLFSIFKEGNSNKIDTTIAVGLAYYSQQNDLISKKADYDISIELSDEEGKTTSYLLISQGDRYPFETDKKLSELLAADNELQYFENETETLLLPFIKKSGDNEQKEVVLLGLTESKNEDPIELFFNLEIDEIFSVTIKNLNTKKSLKKTINL